MSTRNAHTDARDLTPGVAQALIFLTGAVIYGVMAVSAGSALLWGLYLVILACAVALSAGVLRFRAKGLIRPRWIVPLGSFALIVALVFGAVHTSVLR